jgi:hypothetical protein
MKRRYSIIVRGYGSDHEVELCQVETNPHRIASALEKKIECHATKYSSVRIVDHGPSDDAVADDDALPPWEDAWK